MSVPVYSVVAYSGTGKTTLLEKLVPELKSRGLRVAVVKHDAHEFDIDRAGKDSWRMTRAGADTVVITSERHTAVMLNHPLSSEELIDRIEDVDIILTEGYKHGAWKKIALFRAATGKPLPACGPFFAVMTDTPLQTDAPTLDLNDAAGLAALICADLVRGV